MMYIFVGPSSDPIRETDEKRSRKGRKEGRQNDFFFAARGREEGWRWGCFLQHSTTWDSFIICSLCERGYCLFHSFICGAHLLTSFLILRSMHDDIQMLAYSFWEKWVSLMMMQMLEMIWRSWWVARETWMIHGGYRVETVWYILPDYDGDEDDLWRIFHFFLALHLAPFSDHLMRIMITMACDGIMRRKVSKIDCFSAADIQSDDDEDD